MFEPLDLTHWTEYFLSVAAAAAVLIGLIVVGLSIHTGFIAQSVTHRSHARATLVVLTATMITGLVALTPQPIAWLGVEFGLISIGFAAVNTYNNRRAIRNFGGTLPRDAWVRMGIGYALAATGSSAPSRSSPSMAGAAASTGSHSARSAASSGRSPVPGAS